MARKRAKKFKNNSIQRGKDNSTQWEIYGIIIIALSLLIGISIYKSPSGEAGIYFRKFFLGVFGLAAYVLPVVIFTVGLALILNQGKIKIEKRFAFLCLSIYNIVLILHTNFSYSNRGHKFIEKASIAYEAGKHSKYGGILSEAFVTPLLYVFGKVGTYIVLICTLIILIIAATNISIKDIILLIKSKLKRIKIMDNSTKSEAKLELSCDNTPSEENNEEKVSYEENIEKMDRKIKILDFIKLEDNKEEVPAGKNSVTDINNEISKVSDKNKNIDYIYPTIDLLNESSVKGSVQDKKELLGNAKILEDTLLSFGVEAKVVQVSRGPSVTRYELHPSPGIKVSKIVNLADDLALNLAAPTVRIEAPIPGKAAVGIEIPNKEVIPVVLREVIESKEFGEHESKLSFTLGKDIAGKCIVADLSKMPHLLIAGATGSGKSVCINTLITSLVYKSSPADVKMLMVDPKVVELSVYNGIPHLLIPVVTDPKKAASALYWAVNEMTERYKLFADNNVRNIDSYNSLMDKKAPENKIPRIVIIIDELADLMMVAPSDVEDAICRLSQMARAAGMHLVIATQRPSVDVITGVIKANIPSRISFAVSSQIDSRTILDMSGAEKLLGRGDMLFLPIGENKPLRIQGAFISEKEVESVVKFLKNSSEAEYNDEIIDKIENSTPDKKTNNDNDTDELFYEAVKICVEGGQASASMLQRRLRIGFNRAARLIEEMESHGIVGPQDGSKPRQVLLSMDEFNKDK